VHVRLGVVLSREGGALAKMLTPTKLFLGGPMGRGTQWMPWISPSDLQRLLVRLVEGREESGASERGVINAVAGSVRQHEFMRTLGNILHRPTVFPMPGFLVKLVFGQMGREVLLGSQRVESRRLPARFVMEHVRLEGALRSELGIDR
jgi:NAD dependent epimerase/dehydratase family enzyme